MSEDPEQLLSEALRAQARSAPPASTGSSASTGSAGVAPGGYGLLSGAGEGSLERERAALDAVGATETERVERAGARDTGRVAERDRARPVGTGWLVLLAVVLGLAAGAVVGLLTLV